MSGKHVHVNIEKFYWWLSRHVPAWLCRLCAYIMHTAQEQFIAYVFHCEPSAGALSKTIEAACKVLYLELGIFVTAAADDLIIIIEIPRLIACHHYESLSGSYDEYKRLLTLNQPAEAVSLLLLSTAAIAICFYYLTQKLILILPSQTGSQTFST